MIMKTEDIEINELDDWDIPETAELQINLRELTENFFAPASPLANAAKYGGRPYEHRPQQGQMAMAVAESLQEQTNLCVEAPTGIGKSFAYLVPGIHYAVAKARPLLITTETINLQEQLIEKDLPILHQLLDKDFTFAIAKGRSNYICRRRLKLMTVITTAIIYL